MSASEVATASAAPARSARGEDSGATTAVRSAKVVSGVTLLSRILGLARDVASAALFGTSFVWDAFVLAFMVPNLFRRLFGEGSLSAAFVPVYTQRRERDGRAAALRSLANIHTVLVLVLSAMAAAIVAAGVLLPDAVFAPFFGAGEAGKLALFRSLLPILMPFVVIVCATGLLGGALNVHGRFFVPAFAPVVQNVVWLGGIALAIAVTDSPRSQVMIVAATVVIGGAIGFWHHVIALRRQVKLEFAQAPHVDSPAVCRVTTPAIATDDPALRQVAQRMAPTLLGLGLLQISVLLDTIIAETFVPGDGAVSALYFGNRLMQFPLALIGVAMGIAVFPLLARHAARGETAKLRTTLHDCTRITLFLAIPACVGLVALRDPIIEVIFRRGAFDAEAQARTALVLGCYGLGVIAACVRMLQTRAFFALGDTKTPVKIAVWVLGLNLILNVMLVFTPLREGGLALSTALTAWLSMWLMARVLRRQLSGNKTSDENGDENGRESGDVRAAQVRLRQSLRRSLLAAGAMVAVIVPLDAAIRAAGGWAAMPGLLRVGALVALVGAGVMVFVGTAKWLGASEVREVLRRG